MSDLVLVDGDTATFLPAFGAAMVAVRPGALSASSPASVGTKKICVAGDETSVSVAGCSYCTPQYSIPGTGTLKISQLAGDQKARTGTAGGKAVLLKGSLFTAVFEVQAPAQQPPPGPGAPIPDTTTRYSGRGSFTTANTAVRIG
jgi:hypothetical protein